MLALTVHGLAQAVKDAPATTVAEDLGRRVALLLGSSLTCVVGVSEILESVTGEERENVVIHAIAQGANDGAIEGCLKQMEQKQAAAAAAAAPLPLLKQKSFWIGVLVATLGGAAIVGTGSYLLRRRRR